MAGERARFYAACYLVLIDKGKVLLSKRLNTGFEDGNYGMVSGHIDGNETVAGAMAREAKEEAGIEVDEEDMKVVHVMHRQGPDREYVDFYLTAEKWKGEPRIMEQEKCSDLGWFDIDKMPGNTIGYISFVLGKISSGEFFSEYGPEGQMRHR